MRVFERKDGSIRIEGLGADADLPFLVWDAWNALAANVGDEGCLSLSYDVSPDAERRRARTGAPVEYNAHLVADPEGIPGNMSADVKRLHGWRGTTGDSYREARGWRRVVSIGPRRRGAGWVVVLSADLRPDAD